MDCYRVLKNMQIKNQIVLEEKKIYTVEIDNTQIKIYV